FATSIGTNALLAPTGNGITSVPLATGGAGYVGRPVVNISDPSGSVATAIANFDETTGALTGITITSPGSNYSSPTFTLVAGGGILSPGNSGIGNLTVGGLTLSAGSIVNHQITDASTLDLITVTNTNGLTINGGGYNLLATSTGNPYSTNGVYNLIGYSGTI